jgi:hypothetical protein
MLTALTHDSVYATVTWGTQGRSARRFFSLRYCCYSPAPAPVEECSSVIRCSFKLRTSKSAVASLQHSHYIPICLPEQCSQTEHSQLTTRLANMQYQANAFSRRTPLDKKPGQHAVPGQCFFEANTAGQDAWPTCGSRPMLFRGEHRWALIRDTIKSGLTVGSWYLHEQYDLLDCNDVQFGTSPPTIQRNVSPPFSGSKSKQSKQTRKQQGTSNVVAEIVFSHFPLWELQIQPGRLRRKSAVKQPYQTHPCPRSVNRYSIR